MNAIVNVTPDWGIGFENRLRVSVPEDLRRFRALTEGKTVVLGRKTLETFPGGKPLKNRRNLVLSTDPAYRVEGAEVFHGLPELLAELRDLPRESICVIGGESVYRALLPYCDGALVTLTHCSFRADRFFPNLESLPGWECTTVSPEREWQGISFRYIDYVNRLPLPL